MTQQLIKKVFMPLAGAALLSGAVLLAQAQTYDFVTDYSIVSNPNGAWSYGWEPFRGGPFTLMDNGWTDSSYGTQDVWSSYTAPSSPSIALAVTDINHPTLFVPAGTVNTHPGYNGENPVVRWTVPAAGTYKIEGHFIGNDHGWDWQNGVTTTTDVAVIRGPFEVFSGYVESYDVPLPFSVAMPLLAGETVDFNVGFGRNGSWWHDSTGLAATITKVSDLACTPPPAGTIAWWPGDGNANDIVGGHHGALEGGVTFVPGVVGQTFSFSGPGDTVTIPDDPVLNLESLPASAFEGWFKSNGGSDYEDAVIIAKHTCGVSTGWFFTTDQGCFIGDAYIGGYGVGNLNLDDGRYHHFACVKDGTQYREYIDGVLIGESTGPDAGTPANESVMIGSIISGNGVCVASTHQLFGVADELALHDRALTADDVWSMYLAGSAGKCKVINVAIDIKPGGFPNSINPRSKGVIPVAILTTAAFDTATVDAATVRFGAGGNEAPAVQSALEDVDGDGHLDRILHFSTQQTGIACGTTSGILTGKTTDGQSITGIDPIVTVGCR